MDAADAAMDAMSGLTSAAQHVAPSSRRWNGRRGQRFDTGIFALFSPTGKAYAATCPSKPICGAGSLTVHRHEMPGGQYTNLREQARAMASTTAERHRAGLR